MFLESMQGDYHYALVSLQQIHGDASSCQDVGSVKTPSKIPRHAQAHTGENPARSATTYRIRKLA
jgi:hypothetical protein